MTRHQIPVGDIELVVESSGAVEAPPVVVLHGFAGSSRSVPELVEPIVGAGLRVFAPDLIGHGDTSAPHGVEPYRMSECVAQLEEMSRRLDLDGLTVVGYSMGGRVALQWAVRHPRRFARLVTIGATWGLTEAARRERIAADEALAAHLEANGMAWFAEYWPERPIFATQQHRLSAERREQLLAGWLGQRPHGLANSLLGMGTGAMEPLTGAALAKVAVPSLVLAGEDDQKFVAIGRELEASLPQGRFHTITEAGHAAHLEQPERTAAAVTDFVAST